MTIHEIYHSQIATQAASLTILPVWWPFFSKSIFQRAQITQSISPNNLSHSTFFNNKRNYYRGITANLSMQPLFPITDWILTTLLKKIEEANHREPNIAERMGAGFITGTTTVILANPYEVTVIASQKYEESSYKAFKRILKYTGVKGFYTGWLPMAIRNGTFASSLFVSTPLIHSQLNKLFTGSGKAHDIATMVLASTIPASAYLCVAVPLDLMAIMRQSDPSKKIYTSALQTLKAAYHKHGIGAFKAGLMNRLIACSIEMAGFNLLKNFYLEKLKTS